MATPINPSFNKTLSVLSELKEDSYISKNFTVQSTDTWEFIKDLIWRLFNDFKNLCNNYEDIYGRDDQSVINAIKKDISVKNLSQLTKDSDIQILKTGKQGIIHLKSRLEEKDQQQLDQTLKNLSDHITTLSKQKTHQENEKTIKSFQRAMSLKSPEAPRGMTLEPIEIAQIPMSLNISGKRVRKRKRSLSEISTQGIQVAKYHTQIERNVDKLQVAIQHNTDVIKKLQKKYPDGSAFYLEKLNGYYNEANKKGQKLKLEAVEEKLKLKEVEEKLKLKEVDIKMENKKTLNKWYQEHGDLKDEHINWDTVIVKDRSQEDLEQIEKKYECTGTFQEIADYCLKEGLLLERFEPKIEEHKNFSQKHEPKKTQRKTFNIKIKIPQNGY